MRTVTQLREERAASVRPIFEVLDARGSTRSWLARQIGMSREMVSKFERGDRPATSWFIDDACRVLNIPRERISEPPRLRREAPTRRRDAHRRARHATTGADPPVALPQAIPRSHPVVHLPQVEQIELWHLLPPPTHNKPP